MLITSNDSGCRIIWARTDGTQATGFGSDGFSTIRVMSNGASVANLAGALWLLNDTSNTCMTKGLTINQGSADNEILALKSSDVSHGFTSETEADTYGFFAKEEASNGAGALRIVGLSEAAGGAAARHGIVVEGWTTNSATSNTTTSLGVVELRAWVSGASPAAAENAITFASGSRTIQVIDGSGEVHFDAGTNASAFDYHRDAAVLRSFALNIADPTTVIQDGFREWMAYRREDLERLGLVQFNEDGHHFYNLNRLVMLLVGASWQEHTARRTLEERVLALEAARAGPLSGIGRRVAGWLERGRRWLRRQQRVDGVGNEPVPVADDVAEIT